MLFGCVSEKFGERYSEWLGDKLWLTCWVDERFGESLSKRLGERFGESLREKTKYDTRML